MWKEYLSALPISSLETLHNENVKSSNQSTDGFSEFQLKNEGIFRPSWQQWCNEVDLELSKRLSL